MTFESQEVEFVGGPCDGLRQRWPEANLPPQIEMLVPAARRAGISSAAGELHPLEAIRRCLYRRRGASRDAPVLYDHVANASSAL